MLLLLAPSPLQFGACDLGFHSWVAVESQHELGPKVEKEKQEDEPGAVQRRAQYPETEVVPSGESEVEFCLPHEDGLKQDRITPWELQDMDTHDPGQMRRFEAVGGASLKLPSFDLPAQEIPGSQGLSPNAGMLLGKRGTDRFSFDLPTPAYPGLDRQPPVSGTQWVPDYTQSGKQENNRFPLDRPDRPPPASGTTTISHPNYRRGQGNTTRLAQQTPN